MLSVEKTAKTVDEAIALGLKDLNLTSKDDATITILDSGSKGFLGFGAKPCKVLIEKKFDPASVAVTFLKECTLLMGLIVSFETDYNDKFLNINIVGDNLGVLIGKRGQTLDSLQYLVSLVVNKGESPYVNIILDTENYRKRRKETLETLAKNLAKKAKRTGKKVVLEPMYSYERRIIHAALQNDKEIKTYSEGSEPHRYVVIACA